MIQNKGKGMKKSEIRKTIGVTHAIANCEDCGEEFQKYKNAQALGAMHAKAHKHKVSGEVCLVFNYDGRD